MVNARGADIHTQARGEREMGWWGAEVVVWRGVGAFLQPVALRCLSRLTSTFILFYLLSIGALVEQTNSQAWMLSFSDQFVTANECHAPDLCVKAD